MIRSQVPQVFENTMRWPRALRRRARRRSGLRFAWVLVTWAAVGALFLVLATLITTPTV
jgi:hypothetical protein